MLHTHCNVIVAVTSGNIWETREVWVPAVFGSKRQKPAEAQVAQIYTKTANG